MIDRPAPPAGYRDPAWRTCVNEGTAWRETGLSDYSDGLRVDYAELGWWDAGREDWVEDESPDGGMRRRREAPWLAVRVRVRWEYPRTHYGDLAGEATVDLEGRTVAEALWAAVADGLRPYVGDAYIPTLLALLRQEITVEQAQAASRSDPAAPWYLPPDAQAEYAAADRRERALQARRRWRETHPAHYAALRAAAGACPSPAGDAALDVVLGDIPLGARVVPATVVLTPDTGHQAAATILGRRLQVNAFRIVGGLVEHGWDVGLPWPVVRLRRWQWADGKITLRLDFAVPRTD